MLKFSTPRNAYDLLGLPRSVLTEQIRARYQRLVQGYRRDQRPADLLEDAQFRAWTNAYLTLTGPERREYDHQLRTSRGKALPPDKLAQLPEGRRLLVLTELAFYQRKLTDAVELGKAALKLESRNADGYALLGDILREQGRFANAATMYNYAVQFAPNNRRHWRRVEESTALQQGKALPRHLRIAHRSSFVRPLWAWLVVGLALLAVEVTMLAMHGRWGEAGFLNLPTNFIYVAIGSGFLLGLALAVSALIGPFDDEMLWYQVTGFGAETTPIGIFIGLPGVVFFWASYVFYLVVSLLDEHFSPSVAIALLLCGLTTIAFSFVVPKESMRTVLWLGGNVVFFGCCWGWLFGSIRRRVFEH